MSHTPGIYAIIKFVLLFSYLAENLGHTNGAVVVDSDPGEVVVSLFVVAVKSALCVVELVDGVVTSLPVVVVDDVVEVKLCCTPNKNKT